ncbi:MAG TPA: hypothetical protein VFN40_13020, partial [Gemmatimonadales bacterium]|nr:hypothetical protein [Gemmatimonadales bacterium]
MVRLPVLALSTLLLAAVGRRPAQIPGARSPAGDTVQAGDPVVAADRLRPFSLLRHLTLTRGDTVKPFGRQSEQLTTTTLDGRPVLLDVLTFETPNATTVDSSWIDARSLRPLRMRSSNSARVVSLEFEGQRVRGGTTPATGSPTTLDQRLAVRPFEWNMFGLAVSALPLRPGYRATMPVFLDRFGRVAWYAVEVVRDTSLVRADGRLAP